MAGMEKTEFQFPEEGGESENEIRSKEAKESEELSANIGDDDSIQVEVVDDVPPEDKNRKVSDPPEEVTEDELDSYSEKVRKRLQHFSKGYHDERRAKEQALRERQELERVTQHLSQENKKLKEDVAKNQQVLLEQAKRVVANELDSAKRKYREAYDAGDSEGVVAAQEELTVARLKADKLASFKIPALQEENSRVESQQPAPAPVDERAKAWAEKNPWFGTDDEMTSYALGLHNKLVKQNVDPRSDKYYEVINARMRELFPDQFELEEEQEEVQEEVQPAKQRRANVVAPATRSTAPKKIKLTELQVNYAKKYNIPLEKYALEVAKLQRNKNG